MNISSLARVITALKTEPCGLLCSFPVSTLESSLDVRSFWMFHVFLLFISPVLKNFKKPGRSGSVSLKLENPNVELLQVLIFLKKKKD